MATMEIVDDVTNLREKILDAKREFQGDLAKGTFDTWHISYTMVI